jgi:ribosomal protein S18 acetylase RimI-like enzyme
MSEVTFRTAGHADVAAVVRLVESAYRGQESRAGWTTEADLLDGQRTDADAVSEIIAATDREVLLGYIDDGLVACCELQGRDGATAYFGMFAVVPAQQGGGIGAQVLAEAERKAAATWGARVMEMTVIGQRTELIEWYERKGYARTGETRPFPHGDERFGVPRRDDLEFVVLAKSLE